MRKMHGAYLEQPNHKKKCLDYLMSEQFYDLQKILTTDYCRENEHFCITVL